MGLIESLKVRLTTNDGAENRYNSYNKARFAIKSLLFRHTVNCTGRKENMI